MTNKSFYPVQVADGTIMDIWVTYPDKSARYPAIVLLHETFGINAYIQSVAERLCRAGYAVFAPDLFHRKGRPLPAPCAPSTIVKPHVERISEDGLLFDIQSVFDLATSTDHIDHDHMGVVGFGMGGKCSFIANGNFCFSAGVSYYACGLEKLAEGPIELQSPHLFFWAGQDSYITIAEADRISQLNKNHARAFTSVTISYAEHGFHRDECSSYHPLAARQAWMHTLAFLDYLLK